MDTLGTAKILLGILCFMVGLVLHTVALFSPYWYQGEDLHGGLWVVCEKNKECQSISNAKMQDYFGAVQTAEVISALSSVLSVGTLLWLVIKPSKYTVRNCLFLSLCVGTVTLVADTIFLILVSYQVDWAAYLDLSAGVTMVLAALFFFLESWTITTDYQPMP